MANLVESHAVAPMEATGKTWKLKIISGDTQGSSAFYPASVLEAQSDIVKQGTRIYLDHPSLDEAETRPERSAKDIIGYFKGGSEYEGTDLYAEAEFFSDWREWVKERAEAGVIGMSIRGSGQIEESDDGVPTLTRFDNIMSVDLVTVPGAGGGFEKILEAERNHVEKEETMEFPKELAEALDTQAKDVKALTESVTALIESLKPAPEEKKVEEAKTASAAEVADKLVEAGFGKAARARVVAAVDGGADLEEAIKAEKDLAESVLAEAKATKEAAFEGNLEEAGKEKEFPGIFGD